MGSRIEGSAAANGSWSLAAANGSWSLLLASTLCLLWIRKRTTHHQTGGWVRMQSLAFSVRSIPDPKAVAVLVHLLFWCRVSINPWHVLITTPLHGPFISYFLTQYFHAQAASFYKDVCKDFSRLNYRVGVSGPISGRQGGEMLSHHRGKLVDLYQDLGRCERRPEHP